MQVMEVNGHRLAVGFRVVIVRDGLQQEVFNRLQLLIQGLRRRNLIGGIRLIPLLLNEVFKLFANTLDVVDGVYGQIGFVGQQQSKIHTLFDFGVRDAEVRIGQYAQLLRNLRAACFQFNFVQTEAGEQGLLRRPNAVMEDATRLAPLEARLLPDLRISLERRA